MDMARSYRASAGEMNPEEITRFLVEFPIGGEFSICFFGEECGEGYAVGVVMTNKGFGGKGISSWRKEVFFKDKETGYYYSLEKTCQGKWVIKSEEENILKLNLGFREGLRVKRVGCRNII